MSVAVRKHHTTLTVSRLAEVIRYEPGTGHFYWLEINGSRQTTKPAGTINATGYCEIKVLNCHVKAHRLAWFIVHGEWPDGHIDHANRVRHDNRMKNLRIANRSQQSANTKRNTRNKSGFRGVRQTGPSWQAQIRVDGKLIYLGLHKTKHAAKSAVDAEGRKHFGEFYNP